MINSRKRRATSPPEDSPASFHVQVPPGEDPQSVTEQFYACHQYLKPTKPSKLRHSKEQSPDLPAMGRTSKDRETLESARAKRKERDDEELYQGMRRSKLRQRGWNGEREAERQQTIQRYHQKEQAYIEEEIEKERENARPRRPSGQVRAMEVSEQDMREATEQV